MPPGSFAAARPGGSTALWGFGSLGMERRLETFLGRAQMGLACPRLSLWPRVAGRSAGRAPALTSSVTLSYFVISGSSHSRHRCFIVLLSAVSALQPHVRHPVLASRWIDNHCRLTCTHNSRGALGCREVPLQRQGDQGNGARPLEVVPTESLCSQAAEVRRQHSLRITKPSRLPGRRVCAPVWVWCPAAPGS